MKRWEGFQKGINIGGWLSQCDNTIEHYDNFIHEEDVEKIASWKMDHIRIPVDYQLLETEDGVLKEENFKYIDNAIAWCRKYGLNMILDLHKTAGFAFDEQINNGFDLADKFFQDESLKKRFLDLWKVIANRYKNDTDIVAFEPLNEISDTQNGKCWNELVNRWIKAIREICPDVYMVIGGIFWNSIRTMSLLKLPEDSKIIYNFHCYDPMPFTHQKAYWVDSIPKDITVNYPDTFANYEKVAVSLGEIAGAFANNKSAMIDKAFLEKGIKEAVDFAVEKDVALYCGEYGVIDLAPVDDTINWYKDMHSIFEKNGIGRAAWTYKALDFGLVDARLDNVREALIENL